MSGDEFTTKNFYRLIYGVFSPSMIKIQVIHVSLLVQYNYLKWAFVSIQKYGDLPKVYHFQTDY